MVSQLLEEEHNPSRIELKHVMLMRFGPNVFVDYYGD